MYYYCLFSVIYSVFLLYLMADVKPMLTREGESEKEIYARRWYCEVIGAHNAEGIEYVEPPIPRVHAQVFRRRTYAMSEWANVYAYDNYRGRYNA